MDSLAPPPPPTPFDTYDLRTIVPSREVLTELARGFLLERDRDPAVALRFACTFLKERRDSEGRGADPEAPSPFGPPG